MPEGPSLVILKEEALIFKGKKVIEVSGNSKVDIQRMKNQKVVDVKTWGKHFIICFKSFSVRIHLMLFGSYRINERKENSQPRLALKFKNGELNFYTCSVKLIDEELDEIYDWEVDTMSDRWNPERAVQSLKALKKVMVCDVLLDQNIFAGSGNIVKNEVLYRIKLHPETLIGDMPPKKLKELVDETRNYCFDFYEWKKKFELRKHWLAYKQKMCLRCNIPITLKYLGKTNRRTFFCVNCQKLYRNKK